MMKSVVGIFSSLAGGWLNETAMEAYLPMDPVVEQSEPEQTSGTENK